MVVRMCETRVVVAGPHEIQVLNAGREYDLPKEFAAWLLLERKAEFRPGRLPNFNPRQIKAPSGKKPKFITLED